MTAGLALRGATALDVAALVDLLGVLFTIEADFQPDPERQRDGLALLLASPARSTVLVAERAGGVVGMVTAQLVVSTAEGGPSAWVEDLVVLASERRRGTGRALLEAARAWAATRGARRLQLLADRDNASALAFYARLGWSGTQLVCLRSGARAGP